MKQGDVVYLKSGSPELTVTTVDPENEATVEVGVAWMDGSIVRHTSFPAACLTKTKPNHGAIGGALG